MSPAGLLMALATILCPVLMVLVEDRPMSHSFELRWLACSLRPPMIVLEACEPLLLRCTSPAVRWLLVRVLSPPSSCVISLMVERLSLLPPRA